MHENLTNYYCEPNWVGWSIRSSPKQSLPNLNLVSTISASEAKQSHPPSLRVKRSNLN